MRNLFGSIVSVTILMGIFLLLSSSSRAVDATPATKVDFARQIQPILAEKCHQCHGSEKQKADLRLDIKSAAMQGGASGKVIIPGKSAESLLIKHVLGVEDHKRMPPEPNEPLTAEQINLVRQWIDAGADWPEAEAQADDPRKKHWAYQPPVRVEPPPVQKADWPRNPIDHFILARLEKEGMTPSPEADRETLIRRASLDLIGLPPTVEEIDAFIADQSPDAYEKLIDRLLASPHYGENWARDWLDAARYADTNGYEKDRPRTMWRYRDWVIQAFNEDMPFDRFTIEQLAGDMLPNAGEAQKIATAFHRNTMFSEEGGVDKEEYRYYSIVDRVSTTGTVFLGMTIACSQCHNHKYDPITQREYYQFFSMLNNQDEPILETPTMHERENAARADAEIVKIESRYEDEFQLPYDQLSWTVLTPNEVSSIGKATLTPREDRSIIVSGESPATDTYNVVSHTTLKNVVALRVEVLTDSSLPRTGPGRAPNGNFVLSEFTVKIAARDKPDARTPVALWNASADFSQPSFAVIGAIDGNASTGWAVDPGSAETTHSRTATFETKEVLNVPAGTFLAFSLEQLQGGQHTIGRFRISAGTLTGEGTNNAAEMVKSLRRDYRASEQAKWEVNTSATAAEWRVLKPVTYKCNSDSTMTRLDDQSILVTGDAPNRDVYTVEYDTDLTGITAFRLEAIADPRLPFRGPGRGSGIGDGNFMINELNVTAKPLDGPGEPVPVKWKGATATYHGNFGGAQQRPEHAIDGSLDSGWSVADGIGRSHYAVFELEPVGYEKGTRFTFNIIQHYLDQHTLGRFRILATNKVGRVKASPLPAEIESVFTMPRQWRNQQQQDQITKYFLAFAPQLSALHDRVADLQKITRNVTTTLVMLEREKPRKTHIHIRGDYLTEGEEVSAGVPAVLPPLPKDQPPNRLVLARWLVDGNNPLTARVTINRIWQNYFGQGLVTTTEDFGLRAEKPSHSELLDWLATEFVRQKWSMKTMHRLIVTSATYRQQSHITPDLYNRDPYNILLARGPRHRMPAELVRDTALRVSGLLAPKIGGPSVYPPQPAGVTSAGMSHVDIGWPTSTGEDRYRRGIYTFLRRSAPFAGAITFDGTTRDFCVVKRTRSNTPLQALTLLNDPVFTEAAQALGRRIMEQGPPDPRQRIIFAFRLTTARNPQPAEVDRLLALFEKQLAKFPTTSTAPAEIALGDAQKTPPANIDVRQLAAWTMVANVLLNLDETITKG